MNLHIVQNLVVHHATNLPGEISREKQWSDTKMSASICQCLVYQIELYPDCTDLATPILRVSLWYGENEAARVKTMRPKSCTNSSQINESWKSRAGEFVTAHLFHDGVGRGMSRTATIFLQNSFSFFKMVSPFRNIDDLEWGEIRDTVCYNANEKDVKLINQRNKNVFDE